MCVLQVVGRAQELGCRVAQKESKTNPELSQRNGGRGEALPRVMKKSLTF